MMDRKEMHQLNNDESAGTGNKLCVVCDRRVNPRDSCSIEGKKNFVCSEDCMDIYYTEWSDKQKSEID